MIEGYIIIGTDESGKTVRYNNKFLSSRCYKVCRDRNTKLFK